MAALRSLRVNTRYFRKSFRIIQHHNTPRIYSRITCCRHQKQRTDQRGSSSLSSKESGSGRGGAASTLQKKYTVTIVTTLTVTIIMVNAIVLMRTSLLLRVYDMLRIPDMRYRQILPKAGYVRHWYIIIFLPVYPVQRYLQIRVLHRSALSSRHS